MSATAERLSRLEAAYEYLATKADIASLKAEMQLLKWGMGLLVLLVGALFAAVISGR